MSSFMRFMRRFLLVLVCLLPALAGAADRFNLARVLVTGSQRYREDDLVRATGLIVNTQVTADDLQNAANRLGNSGAFSSVQFLFKTAIGTKGVEADFQVADAEKYLPALFENFVWFSDQELQEAVHQAVPLYHGELPTSGQHVRRGFCRIEQISGLAKDCPARFLTCCRPEFGQLPTAYKFRVADANLKVQRRHSCGRCSHVAGAAGKGRGAAERHRLSALSDVAIVLEKNLVPIYRQHGYLKFADC